MSERLRPRKYRGDIVGLDYPFELEKPVDLELEAKTL